LALDDQKKKLAGKNELIFSIKPAEFTDGSAITTKTHWDH
jgi:hypothetical protein